MIIKDFEMITKIIIIILIIFVCCNEKLYCDEWVFPDDLYVSDIYFNHTTGSQNSDALTIKSDHYTTITGPEYFNGADSQAVAYIRDKTVGLRAGFYRTTFDITSCEVTVESDGGDSIGDFTSRCGGWPPYTYRSYPMDVDNTGGSIINQVKDTSVTLDWIVTEVNGEAISPPVEMNSTTKQYYVVLADPVAPMAQPWVEVLEYACNWASGKSSISDVATEVTKGIYNMDDDYGNIDYDSASHYTHELYSYFSLSEFLDDVNDDPDVEVNCYDCASLVGVFTKALGCSPCSKYKHGPFDTEVIDLIGYPTPSTDTFNNHMFGYIDSKVYDACLKIGSTYPCNMEFGDYEDALLDDESSWSSTLTYVIDYVY